MRRPILAVLAAVVLLLAACDPTPAPPVDLSNVTAAVDALSTRVDDMAGRLDLLRADVTTLTDAAIQLQAAVAQPLDLARVQWGALTGVVVQTVPPNLEVTVQPGACPDGTPVGLNYVLDGQLIGTSFHPLPAGTHCLVSLADEEYQAAGVTVTVRDGVFVAAALMPARRPE